MENYIVRIYRRDSTDPDRFHGVLESVEAVPLPASMWLFGSGMIGLITSVRQKISWHPCCLVQTPQIAGLFLLERFSFHRQVDLQGIAPVGLPESRQILVL